MSEENKAQAKTETKPTPPAPPAPRMKVCSILLRMDKFGSSVVKEGVTPAEMLLLVAEHKDNANALPVTKIWDETTVERSDAQELARLRSIYAPYKIKALYPGASPTFPTSFKDAQRIGMELDPGDKESTFKLA